MTCRRLFEADRCNGFTLLEVLVAGGVLATAVVSLVHLFALAARANLDARGTTYGAALAMQKIEELRAMPFPDTTPLAGEDALDTTAVPIASGGGLPAYRRRWTIESFPVQPTSIVITVVVSSEAEPEYRALQLTTIRARRQ